MINLLRILLKFFERLDLVKQGQSICGTQSSTSVETCLDKTLNPGYDDKDNLQCQALGPFKSKDAVRAGYLDQARIGTYNQERRWRQDQKSEDIFQGQCKEPSQEL